MTGRRAGALVAAGVVLLATALTGAVATAQEESQLGFFEVSADSTGIGASFGDPTRQPYPVAAGFVPNAFAQLSTGPSGVARSTLMWPGPLIGSAGSLVNVIGTPLPPEVGSQLNYPLVAQAEAGAGGSDEATLGPMTAKVDGSDSRASTTIEGFSAPDVVTAAQVVTTSRTHLEGGKAIAVAETVMKGVDVGGVLKIADLRTVARGTSDGVAATTAHEVTVSGVTVGDQAATIDGDGLHLGEGTVPLGEVLAGAKPATDGFGVRAFITDPLKQESSGGAAALDSGSVVIEWSPPESGQFFTVVLGGSSVRLSATPGSAFGTGGAGDEFFTPADPGTVLPTPSFSPSADGGVSLPAPSVGSNVASGGASQPDSPIAAPIQSGVSLDLASAVSDRVPLGWVLVGILGALLAGAGLHNFRQQALAAAIAGTSCPLEQPHGA